MPKNNQNHTTLYVCPFWGVKKGNVFFCEGGKFKFHDLHSFNQYVSKYCCDIGNYKKCTICKALNEYYGVKDD